MDEEIGFTVEENDLLNRMAAGELDGFVDKPLMTPKGVSFWLVILDGNPTCYIELPTNKELVNGEIRRSFGTMLSVKSWLTDEEKLEFLRENGDEMTDEAVKAYAQRKRQTKAVERIIIDWSKEHRIYQLEVGLPVQ